MRTWAPQPLPFFAGFAIGVLLCALAGRYYASQNIFEPSLVRFHQHLSPESGFYPTASQLLRLAEARIPPDRIGVVVGGTSVLNGVGQRDQNLWTRKLQAELGGKYAVLNLAARGGQTQEFGNWVSEMLLSRGRRIVHVTDLAACNVMMSSPCGENWRYFFWDAYYKGLLTRWPPREDRIRHSRTTPQDSELKLRYRLDRWLYFNDLWGALAYLHFRTYYSWLLGPKFWRPLRENQDPETASPPESDRYPAARLEADMEAARRMAAPCRGSWRDKDALLRASITGPVLRKTIVLLIPFSPYYRDRLPPEQQREFDQSVQETEEFIRRNGATPLRLSQWDASDFHDILHLAEPGGEKLGAAVAAVVREKVRQWYGGNL